MIVICADCTQHREVIDSDGREIWKCAAPQKVIPDYVTGVRKPTNVLCMVKNSHGNCEDFKEGPPPVEQSNRGWLWRWWLPIWFLAAGTLLVLAKFARGGVQ